MSSSDDSEQTKLGVQLEISNFQRDFPHSQYIMLEKIGQGTFSSVYKSIDSKHQHTSDCKEECSIVAVKRIYPTSSPTRILTELSILHALSGHPNVAPLINAIRHEDQHYFRELSTNQIKGYMRSLLSGLKHVHQKGFIHRDVKPSNFIYSPESETGNEADRRVEDLKFKQPKPMKLEKKRPFYIVDRSFETNIPTIGKEIGLCYIIDKMNEMPVDELALDLLEKLMELDPAKRITASEALRHPFLQ
ncbi:Cell division control protein 7 [Terramyces sp. JEL0728]|nr:Cell division control protein 7 [Terramyces sp. JEL0728]